MFVEELNDFAVGLDAVVEFRDATALIIEDPLPDGDALLGGPSAICSASPTGTGIYRNFFNNWDAPVHLIQLPAAEFIK